MFASKTPRDLNHDPYPNVWDGHSEFNQMRADHHKFRRGAPVGVFGSMVYRRRPRPEFDHVQHNEPNPILVEFRKRDWYYAHVWNEAAWWIPGLANYQADPAVSDEQIEHARKVLTRLDALRTVCPHPPEHDSGGDYCLACSTSVDRSEVS